MLGQLIEHIPPTIVVAPELMGIFTAVVLALDAFGRYLKSLFTRTPYGVKFTLASGLTLSLEFKTATEILKTVLMQGLREPLVLGAAILLRALLSFLIHPEMKGTCPPK